LVRQCQCTARMDRIFRRNSYHRRIFLWLREGEFRLPAEVSPKPTSPRGEWWLLHVVASLVRLPNEHGCERSEPYVADATWTRTRSRGRLHSINTLWVGGIQYLRSTAARSFRCGEARHWRGGSVEGRTLELGAVSSLRRGRERNAFPIPTGLHAALGDLATPCEQKGDPLPLLICL